MNKNLIHNPDFWIMMDNSIGLTYGEKVRSPYKSMVSSGWASSNDEKYRQMIVGENIQPNSHKMKLMQKFVDWNAGFHAIQIDGWFADGFECKFQTKEGFTIEHDDFIMNIKRTSMIWNGCIENPFNLISFYIDDSQSRNSKISKISMIKNDVLFHDSDETLFRIDEGNYTGRLYRCKTPLIGDGSSVSMNIHGMVGIPTVYASCHQDPKFDVRVSAYDKNESIMTVWLDHSALKFGDYKTAEIVVATYL